MIHDTSCVHTCSSASQHQEGHSPSSAAVFHDPSAALAVCKRTIDLVQTDAWGKQYSSFLPSHAHLSSSHLLYLLNIIPSPLFNSLSPHHTLPTSSLLPFPPLPPSSHPLNIVPPLSLNILLPQPAEVCRYFLNYVLRGVIEPGSRTFLKGDLRIIVQSTLSLAFVT